MQMFHENNMCICTESSSIRQNGDKVYWIWHYEELSLEFNQMGK